MFSSFEAEVSATNEPYANFVQSTFSSKTPLKIGASFGFFGDSKLKFSLMPMDLDLGVTKIKTKTANLEIGLNKGKVTSADLAISKGDFVYSGLFGAADLVLDGFYSHTTYAGIDFSDILEVVDAKGEISIDKIYSKGLNFELAGIHSVSNQSIKDGKIAGDIDLKIDKFKIIDASIKNFTFELAASNLDKAVYDEIADCYETDEFKDPAAFLKLLSLEPKIDKFALNFENASGKKAEFDLKISMENAKNINYLNIQKSLNLSGKFSTQFALSSISPLLSEFREIEEKLLQVGVLVKKGDGYECKFSFDKEKEDLIFNEEILSAAIYSYD